MLDRRRVFIVNPYAGSGKAWRIAQVIYDYCIEKKINFEMHFASTMEEVRNYAIQAMDGSIIYSVGGDGTLNEVVNGIYGSNKILDVIGAGSGNDFVRTMDRMDKGTYPIDIGSVNQRKFINVASVGIDASIANRVNLLKEKGIAHFLYPRSILYHLSHFKTYSLSLFGKQKNITLLAICNGRYYGNGHMIAPTADLADGFFDVYQVDALKLYQLPPLFFKLERGTHESAMEVHKSYSDFCHVQSEYPLLCNIDGEILEGQEFLFSLLHEGVLLHNEDDIGVKELVKKVK